MSLVVRLHPLGSTLGALERQWILADMSQPEDRPRIAILRTVLEDPDRLADLASAGPMTQTQIASLAGAWADAQLVADASALGLAVGVRIVLVSERHRWFADTYVIRNGRRLRTGRGYRDPLSALRAIRRSYAAGFGDTNSPGVAEPFPVVLPERVDRDAGEQRGRRPSAVLDSLQCRISLRVEVTHGQSETEKAHT